MAAAATGFVIGNTNLIITGSLVGASGLILTAIMCKAMNRTLTHVLFGILEAGASSQTDDEVYAGKVKSTKKFKPWVLIHEEEIHGETADARKREKYLKTGYGKINARKAYRVIEQGNHVLDSVAQGGGNTHLITVPSNVKEVKVIKFEIAD